MNMEQFHFYANETSTKTDLDEVVKKKSIRQKLIPILLIIITGTVK